ncbi:MAG: 2Fe-2S iron-sulfur cluster-binding protein, partial [Bacillota bacterium]
MVALSFYLNGSMVTTSVEPWESLLEVLRNRLGMIGTKCGCNRGDCGACTVILDGRAVNSCLIPALKVQDRHVTTIEGLGTRESLHPLQEAFIEHGAIQCGYCTPGMILRAKALLDSNRTPSREDIAEALSGNLCRCTGYEQIIEAVQSAATRTATVKPADYGDGRHPDIRARREGYTSGTVGRPTPSLDAADKALGKARFAGDISLAQLLHCKTLRSPHPYARLMRIETARAKAIPGVRAVITADDITG